MTGIRLMERVGEGGMSEVWKAWEEKTSRIIAVKVLRGEYAAANGKELAAFKAEERLMQEIRHPGVVEAYELGNADGVWYFTMEFVDGYNFSQLLKRKQRIPESDCLLICESVAAALDHAWNEHGIVHCDIKPENIMINTSGAVKLTDLGISHRFENIEGTVKVPDHILGTPAYISPEQVYGDVELDCRSDIYSLAATLFHLATGRVLFNGLGNDDMMRAHCDEHTQCRDPRTYRPDITESFAMLLEAMLVKDRDYRVSSWRSVYEMCREIENGGRFKPRLDAAVSSVKLLPLA